MISQKEKENILLSAYAYADNIDTDEEVTFDGLLQFVADGAEVENNQDTEIVLRDFMMFAGQDKPTLDSLEDSTLAETLKTFADSFEGQDELFTTIDGFLDDTTMDKVCDAKHEPHVTHHADGSVSKVCKYKKGAVHERETFEERMGRAKRKNRRVSALTRLKISKGLKNHFKKNKHKKNKPKGH